MMPKPTHSMQPSAFGDPPLPPVYDPFAPTTGLLPTWESTRPFAAATHVFADTDDYLDGSLRDIGRPTGDHLRELFVSCDPAPALLQQLELLHPEYLALHDIGTASSKRLLAAVAAASQRPLQQLAIRRHGYGTPLATLEFIEFDAATAGAPPLRLYSTECDDADTASRHGLARVLLAHSRLAVIIVGDLPSHALAQALQPLQGDIAAGQWKNGQVLMLPLASGAALASLGSQFGRGGGRRDSSRGGSVTVRTTPQIGSPAEAWHFISATWNRLGEQLAMQGIALAVLPASGNGTAAQARIVAGPAAAVGGPALPEPVQVAAAAAGRPASTGPTPLQDYAQQLMQINGVLAACVFEAAAGRPLAHCGAAYQAADLAREGAALLASLSATETRLAPAPLAPGRGNGTRAGDAKPSEGLPEAAVTLARHHLLVRPLPRRAGLAAHVVFDRSRTNLTLARLQIARLDSLLDADASGRAATLA